MHLTQLRLDPRGAAARRDLANPYDMHRTLVRAFVQDSEQAPPRFLWRLESDSAWQQPVVLIQSENEPDWTFLAAVPGYLKEGGVPQTRTFSLEAHVQPSARCRFRLVANPTVCREGKRHGLVGEEAQLAWLTRQGERLGFSIEYALVSGSDTLRGGKKGLQLNLRRVIYEGVFRVEDAEALTTAMTVGIGPGKAFGCGLLSAVRMR